MLIKEFLVTVNYCGPLRQQQSLSHHVQRSLAVRKSSGSVKKSFDGWWFISFVGNEE
jgi:hypothetical protein